MISSPAVGGDGTIYVGSNDNALHAVKPDGARKWLYATGDDVISSPALYGGLVLVLSSDGWLHAARREARVESQPDSTRASRNEILKNFLSGRRGTTVPQNTVVGFRTGETDGAAVWAADTGHRSLSEPIVDRDGVLYAGVGDGTLRAFDLEEGGALLWMVKTADSAFDGEPAFGSGGRLYSATLNSDDTLACYGPTPPPPREAPPSRKSPPPAGWTTGQMVAWFLIGALCGAGAGARGALAAAGRGRTARSPFFAAANPIHHHAPLPAYEAPDEGGIAFELVGDPSGDAI